MKRILTSTILRASALVAGASLAMAQSPAPVPFCFGDGTQAACPCENTGAPGRGCENSTLGGGAILWVSGHSRIGADSVQLHVQGEPRSALSIVFQGDAA
jgi:hypothetical protein